jgi:HPt (histidine-containing phosphotransfer) domain-containing protein
LAAHSDARWRIWCRQRMYFPLSGRVALNECMHEGEKMSLETQQLEHAQEKPFDFEKALNNMDGDQELFQNLVSVFVEESSYRMKEIREGIQRADAIAVEKAAHAIKGTVGNFAAQRTLELAYRLEVLGRQCRHSEMPKALAELEQEMDLLREALRSAVA